MTEIPAEHDTDQFLERYKFFVKWLENDKLTLKDIALYFHAAWNSFLGKITVFATILTIVGFIIGLLFPADIPETVKRWSIGIFTAITLLLLIITSVRANNKIYKAYIRVLIDNKIQHDKIQELRALNSAYQTTRKTHYELFACNADLYGLCYESAKFSTKIDTTGGANANYELNILASRNDIRAIERYSFCSLDVEISLETLGAIQVVKKVNSDRVTLTPKIISATKTEAKWKLEASPCFPRGVAIPYSYSPAFHPSAFVMTSDALFKSNQEYEWVGQTITYPTKSLVLKVEFPKGYSPNDLQAVAWYTYHVRIPNSSENERIKRDSIWKMEWNEECLSAALELEYPLLGSCYAITWVPPAVWAPLT
jgi:hypothetical protein